MSTQAFPIFRLVSDDVRARCIAAIMRTPEKWLVYIKPPTRSRDQNAALHAALYDIAKQLKWHGKTLDVDVWKRLTTAAWLRELGEKPMLVPALDGNGFDTIYEKTSRMTTEQMTSLIEWVLAFGAQNGVKFKDTAHER